MMGQQSNMVFKFNLTRMGPELLDFSQAKALLDDEYSCMKLITRTKKIRLLPSLLTHVKNGIREVLDCELKRFSPELEGVLVAYDNIYLVKEHLQVVPDAFSVDVDIQADYIVFYPVVGSVLKGVANKVGADHVGCLVHGCFNASIPRPRNEETWLGDEITIGDEFLFEVTNVNRSGRFIFFRGVILEKRESKKRKKKTTKSTSDDVLDAPWFHGSFPTGSENYVNGGESSGEKRKKDKKAKKEEIDTESGDKKSKNKNKRKRTESVDTDDESRIPNGDVESNSEDESPTKRCRKSEKKEKKHKKEKKIKIEEEQPEESSSSPHKKKHKKEKKIKMEEEQPEESSSSPHKKKHKVKKEKSESPKKKSKKDKKSKS